jgi:hypothetical protein
MFTTHIRDSYDLASHSSPFELDASKYELTSTVPPPTRDRAHELRAWEELFVPPRPSWAASQMSKLSDREGSLVESFRQRCRSGSTSACRSLLLAEIVEPIRSRLQRGMPPRWRVLMKPGPFRGLVACARPPPKWDSLPNSHRRLGRNRDFEMAAAALVRLAGRVVRARELNAGWPRRNRRPPSPLV